MLATDSYPIHVRTRGQSYQLRVRASEVPRTASDGALTAFVERALGLGTAALRDHAIDRAGEAIVIRPWAVWG